MSNVANSINAFNIWVDDTVLFFSRSIYESLVADNTTAIISLFAISIALYGWLILQGKLEFTMRESLNHLLLVGGIAVLLTNYDVYNQLIYGWFTIIPDALAGSILKAMNFKDLDTSSSLTALSIFVDRTLKLVRLFWENDLELKLGAVAIACMSVFLFGAFLGILLVSKLCTGILLAEAPIFLICAIFKSTKGLTEGWLRQLWAMFIAQLMGFGVMTVIILILRHPVEQFEDGYMKPSLESVLNLALIMLPLLWLAKQMFAMAQSIAGGFVMQQYSASRDGVLGQTKQLKKKYDEFREKRRNK